MSKLDHFETTRHGLRRTMPLSNGEKTRGMQCVRRIEAFLAEHGGVPQEEVEKKPAKRIVYHYVRPLYGRDSHQTFCRMKLPPWKRRVQYPNATNCKKCLKRLEGYIWRPGYMDVKKKPRMK